MVLEVGKKLVGAGGASAGDGGGLGGGGKLPALHVYTW